MGPMLIFDKSFLEAINQDEAVWLNEFFCTNITPVFYLETLADLAKKSQRGTGEKLVSDLAKKTPTGGAFPNTPHIEMLVMELFGGTLPLTTRQAIVRYGDVREDGAGQVGHHIEEFPEQTAFNRWLNENFLELEQTFAAGIRESLNNLSFDDAIAKILPLLPPDYRKSSLQDIRKATSNFGELKGLENLNLAMEVIGVPGKAMLQIQLRYIREGQPPIKDFAPYFSYVFCVDAFFYAAVFHSRISKDRLNNKTDLAYLYYLPFCEAFVTGDNVQYKVAELFLDDDQTIVKASDLKKALDEINQYYEQYRVEIEKYGVMRVIGYPPGRLNNALTDLWDKYCRDDWRTMHQEIKPPKEQKLPEELMERWGNAKPVNRPVKKSEIQYAMVKRTEHLRKGSWQMLPPDFDKKG